MSLIRFCPVKEQRIMDLTHDAEAYLAATRRDGWTPALKARFLSLLAENGNARLAARR